MPGLRWTAFGGSPGLPFNEEKLTGGRVVLFSLGPSLVEKELPPVKPMAATVPMVIAVTSRLQFPAFTAVNPVTLGST